jgi:two-component system sensor histidine kinase KdpD
LRWGNEARIFERFARAASSGVSGTGLGLAIVKGFVSLMGAQVSARNRSDRSGAVFTIDFPAERLA